jgi:hypothetical protein
MKRVKPTLEQCDCSQWSRGLSSGPASTRLLGLRVRILLEAWISVSCWCFYVRRSSVRRADHSSRGVLLSVFCLTEWCLDNEEALAH